MPDHAYNALAGVSVYNLADVEGNFFSSWLIKTIQDLKKKNYQGLNHPMLIYYETCHTKPTKIKLSFVNPPKMCELKFTSLGSQELLVLDFYGHVIIFASVRVTT